eukprot:EC823712.1.p1 GENE.EC823712.1~~EC823712.1.p1  ORF type:complete len:125 (+),score=42.63 EC823712.1:137-511(+)
MKLKIVILKLFQLLIKMHKNYIKKIRKEALKYITDFSKNIGDNLTKDWFNYWRFIFAKYMDGNVKFKNSDPKEKNPVVQHPGYPQPWFDRIVRETGDHFKVYGNANSKEQPIITKSKALRNKLF